MTTHALSRMAFGLLTAVVTAGCSSSMGEGTTASSGSHSKAASDTDPEPRIVAGYYPNFTPSPPRIRDVDPRYNLIYLFAATPVGGPPGNGTIEWRPPGDALGAATHLVADMAYARHAQGRKIILSVGGARNNMSFPDRATSQAFIRSIEALYSELGGFDGIDWDTFEGSTPDTTEVIWMSRELRSVYPGFMITAPPAPESSEDMELCLEMAIAGVLDYCAPQYYGAPGLAEPSYVASNVANWVAVLGSSKVVVGLGVSAHDPSYATIAQAVAAWKAVETGTPVRGAFDWQLDEDYGTGWLFANQIGSLIDP
jgi:chitinase